MWFMYLDKADYQSYSSGQTPCFIGHRGGGGAPNFQIPPNFPVCGGLFQRFDPIFERFSAFGDPFFFSAEGRQIGD